MEIASDQFYIALKDKIKTGGHLGQPDVLDIASHEQMTLDQFQQWTNRFIVAIDQRKRQISKTRDHLNDAEIDLSFDPVPKVPFQGLVNDDKYDDRQALATEIAKLTQRAEATDLLLTTVKDTGEYNMPHLFEFPQRGKLNNEQYLIQLRKFLISHLTFQELEGLATSFLSAEDAEQVVRQGRGVNSRALNFVSHFQRHGNLDQLAQAVNDYVQEMGLAEGVNIPQRQTDAEQTRETLLKEANFWQAAYVVRSCFESKNPDKKSAEAFLKSVPGFEKFAAQSVTSGEEISQDRLMAETIVFTHENGLLENLMTALSTSETTKDLFMQSAKQAASLSPIPSGQEMILNYDQLFNVIAILRAPRANRILDDLHTAHSYAKYPALELERIIMKDLVPAMPNQNMLGLIVQSVIESTQTFIPPKPEAPKKSRTEDYAENASSFRRFAETGYLLNTCFGSMEELHEFVLSVRGFEHFARWHGKTKNQLALEIFLEAEDKGNLFVLAQELAGQKAGAVENALLAYQQISTTPIEDLAQQEVPFVHEMATIAYLSPSSYQDVLKTMKTSPQDAERQATTYFLSLMKDPSLDHFYQLFRSVRTSISSETKLETGVFKPVVIKPRPLTYYPQAEYTPPPPPPQPKATSEKPAARPISPEQELVKPENWWKLGYIMAHVDKITNFAFDNFNEIYYRYQELQRPDIMAMQVFLDAYRTGRLPELAQLLFSSNDTQEMAHILYRNAGDINLRPLTTPVSQEEMAKAIIYVAPDRYPQRLTWPALPENCEALFRELQTGYQQRGQKTWFEQVIKSVQS